MFLDVDLRSRELVIFRSVPGSTDRLDSLFEVHMQVVFHKDAEPEMTKKIFLLLSPIKSLKKHICRIRGQMTLFAISAGTSGSCQRWR